MLDLFAPLTSGRFKFNRRIFWDSPSYFCNNFSCSAVANNLATPFNTLPVLEIFQPFHSFHSFHPYTHPTFAALIHLLHLPSFFTCLVARSLVHSRSLIHIRPFSLLPKRRFAAAPWPSHGTLAVTPLYTARHPLGPGPVMGYPASPCPARADSEYRYPLGSCRLGFRPRSHPCSGRLGLLADHRLGPTRIPASSHVT